MSKKRTKRKQSPKSSKNSPAKSSPLKIQWGTLVPIIFCCLFGVLAALFLIDFHSSPDNTNDLFLSKAGSTVVLEYGIFTILGGGFLYFVLRSMGGFISRVPKQFDMIVLGLIGMSLITLYSLGFTEEVLPNGDNAEYLINTKSIVERGAPYRLETRSENANSLASIGLPLILTPIYSIWGFDFVKMKVLITLLGLSLFPLLIMIFRKYHDLYWSIALSLVCCVSAHLVSSSTVIMTEVPYMFWSCLTILVVYRYHGTETFKIKWLLLLFACAIMTYLTRAVGISMFGAITIFLIFHIPWRKLPNYGIKRFAVLPPVKKLLFFLGPILFLGVIYQIFQASRGVSQMSIFLADIVTFFPKNLDSATRVLGPMLFSEGTYRWYIFTNNFFLSPFNFLWLAVLILFIIGILISVFRRQLIGIYTLLASGIILLGSQTPAEMVIIRYLTVISPFLVYFIITGASSTVQFAINLAANTKEVIWPKFVGATLLTLMLFNNFGSSAATIALNIVGNGPAYYDYIEVSEWCGRNLPEDSYVLTMKPRLFWLYSERKAGKLSSIDENYSKQYEKKKLNMWKNQGVTHIIIDGMSAATRENISPIVQNNPDLFRTVYVASTAGTAAVIKVNDY